MTAVLTAFIPKPSPARIHFDELGDPDGVTLTAGGMKLFIYLLDSNRGKFTSFADSKKFTLPTVEQALIVMAYIQEVNAKLQEAGGQPIISSYYTQQCYEKEVQIFGYQQRSVYTYVVPTESKAIPCMYKVRQIKAIEK